MPTNPITETKMAASDFVHDQDLRVPEMLMAARAVVAKGDEDVYRAMGSVLPTCQRGVIRELFSWKEFKNPLLWKAGLIEGIASLCLNFVSGQLGIMVSSWPPIAIPAGIFVGNTVLVAVIVYSCLHATGAHINTTVSIAMVFSGLCHPVRGIIYIFCQLVGGTVGGAFLHAGLGTTRALQIHNAGCYLDPSGPTTIGQAFAMEFIAVLCLLFFAFGIGLDPRQAQVYGIFMGPILVGLIVGLLTSLVSTNYQGYSGPGMFPGRCFGLAAGLGVFQQTHWIWWVPDILACYVVSLIYRIAPPYTKNHYVDSEENSAKGDA